MATPTWWPVHAGLSGLQASCSSWPWCPRGRRRRWPAGTCECGGPASSPSPHPGPSCSYACRNMPKVNKDSNETNLWRCVSRYVPFLSIHRSCSLLTNILQVLRSSPSCRGGGHLDPPPPLINWNTKQRSLNLRAVKARKHPMEFPIHPVFICTWLP